jgi:two-component system, NarL family, captular synthesis response regulator RcsB
MFTKVLIAEDLDSINTALVHRLTQSGIQEVGHSKYCEEALGKLRKALADQAPIEVLVTDLSFKEDFKDTAVTSGEYLIREAKQLQPDLKVIVYSIEDKAFTIRKLFEELGIDAYVVKGRHSLPELEQALQQVHQEDTYISPDYAHLMQDRTINEIDGYDLELLRQLSKGIRQDKIGEQFQSMGLKPNSKSAVEKRINRLKDYFKAQTTIQLMAMAKDLGLV